MSGTWIETCHLKNLFFITRPYHHKAKEEPNHYYFFYSVNTAIPIELNDTKMKIRKRQTLLIQANCELKIHTVDFRKGARLLAANFIVDRQHIPDWAIHNAEEKLISSLCEKIDPFLLVSDTNFIYSLLIQIIHEKYLASQHYEQICSSLFVVILYHLSERLKSISPSTADYAKQIYHYIENHYEQDISETQLSDALGISPSHIQKILKRYYQTTFFDIVHRLRIKRAQELLIHSDHTISDIAYFCGFNSRQRFNFIFRKYTGITPSQYKKNSMHNEFSHKQFQQSLPSAQTDARPSECISPASRASTKPTS